MPRARTLPFATCAFIVGVVLVGSSARATGVWTAVDANFVSPATGRYSAGAYDPVRHRWLVFGPGGLFAFTLSGSPVWTQLTPAGAAHPKTQQHSMVYDAANDRMLLFGGLSGGPGNALTALSLGASPSWTALNPSGPLPGARANHAAIYDTANRRMVIFGGDSLDARYYNDVWVLPVDGPPAWQQLTVPGGLPRARTGARAVYDPTGPGMYVYGGRDVAGNVDDAWAFWLGFTPPTWSRISYNGTSPPPRNDHAMVFDPASGRVIVCGGQNLGVGYLGDVWSFDPNSGVWQSLSSGSPWFAPRYAHVAAYDPVGARMVVNGGVGGGGDLKRETLAFPLSPAGDWSPLVMSAPPVAAAASAFDPIHRQMILFGGEVNGGQLGETWTLPLADPAPRWARVFPGGTPPGPRSGHVATWDRLRGRMLVFGGRSIPASSDGLWSFTPDPPSWAPIATQGTYPTYLRQFAGLVHDVKRDRLLVFGGNAVYPDVWALPLGGAGVPTWTTLATTGPGPAARQYHGFVLDPERDAAYVTDGFQDAIPGTQFHDLWRLDLSSSPAAWSQLSLANQPAARNGHVAAYDPTQDRMLVFGGSVSLNDVHGLALATPAWSNLNPTGTRPAPRWLPAAVVDVPGNRLVVYGGEAGETSLGDTWFLTWPASAGVGGQVANTDGRIHARFDRARGEIRVRLASTRGAITRVELMDLAGRRIATRRFDAANLEPGDEVRFDAGGLASGLYFIVAEQLGRSSAAKVAVLR